MLLVRRVSPNRKRLAATLATGVVLLGLTMGPQAARMQEAWQVIAPLFEAPAAYAGQFGEFR